MIIDILKITLCIVVVLLAGFLQTKVNLKKSSRSRQALMPLISFVLTAAAVIINFRFFSNISAAAGDIEFLAIFDLLLSNAAIMLEFIAVKAIICFLLGKLCRSNKFIKATAGAFYELDEDYEEWFLKHKWVNFRKYLFAVCLGTAIAGGLYLGIIICAGYSSPMWSLSYPCAALIVLIEIYCFINGQTKEEFEHSVYGDDADIRKISNFYKIREAFEKLLPEPLLSAQTGFEFADKNTPADLIKELKESGDRIDAVTAEYFSINDRYKNADIDCVQASLQLMHRNNVVFFNPFYRDLSMYITLPLVNTILSGKKTVVITGRMSNTEDVTNWLTELLGRYSHMKSLWRVAPLGDNDPECEVGVLSFPQLYDSRIISTNRKFFSETDFVLLIQPSIIMNTGQVALSIIAQEMSCNDEKPVYCICDRNTDGLVDTLSHLLHTEITEVIAPPLPRCIYTGMSWNADGDFMTQQLFDKQTKYLGNGVELAAIAVKNQIPEVSWYCETKAPVRDIKWIAGQHHSTICKYMNLPAQQKSLYEKINFISNLWSTPTSREQFIIAEDEFCNIFSTMRIYLSRGTAQSFVNVFSENYLLRDYMRCNRQMFMANPNCIPSAVPDYAKTERNTLIKLILLMTYRPVTDAEILNEFHLVGTETTDAFETLSRMLRKYTFADSSVFTVKSVRTELDALASAASCEYTITPEAFDFYFSNSLKNAYFILEEERHDESYIDAKLYNHVTQIILPGQFVTYDGKYYIAKHVLPQCGVVLRRASDLFSGRKYYRQIRCYAFEPDSKETLISLRKLMDIELAFIQRDFSVTTTGYLEMRDNHDLRTARLVDFTGDPSIDSYTRRYRNKTILRIKLPETNDKIRFTLCLMLSEIFRTVFPDGWQYLAVVTRRPEDIDGMLNHIVYSINEPEDSEYIYIIEDSEIDLGLIEAVDRNLMKLMEIIADFLDWHCEKMREPAQKDPIPLSINYTRELAERHKQSLFSRMARRISQLFGGNKEKEVKIADIPEDDKLPIEEEFSESDDTDTDSAAPEPAVQDNESGNGTIVIAPTDNDDCVMEVPDETESAESPAKGIAPASDELQFDDEDFIPSEDEDPEIVHIDGTDIFDNDGMPEDNEIIEAQLELAGITSIEKTRYQNECYLKFGFKEIDSRLQIEGVRNYLRVRGWCNNNLTKARKRDILAKKALDLEAINHCDFCSLPLTGVSYDFLADGRICCNDCARTAITTIEDFRKLFFQVLEVMEAFYGVKYRVPISVITADARTVAKGAGCIFKPSTGFASRVLGFAQRKRGKYSLIIENGSPRLAAIDTMVHEMTHIWQYLNWNDAQIANIYGMNHRECSAAARDIVYEGMAMWASIQYLYQIGESCYASQQEQLAEARNDIYGVGYRLYAEQYPVVKDSSLIKFSPFAVFPTLEPSKVHAAVKQLCSSDKCNC